MIPNIIIGVFCNSVIDNIDCLFNSSQNDIPCLNNTQRLTSDDGFSQFIQRKSCEIIIKLYS